MQSTEDVYLSSCVCELSLSLFFRIDDIEDNSKLRRGIPGKSDWFSAGIAMLASYPGHSQGNAVVMFVTVLVRNEIVF